MVFVVRALDVHTPMINRANLLWCVHSIKKGTVLMEIIVGKVLTFYGVYILSKRAVYLWR